MYSNLKFERPKNAYILKAENQKKLKNLRTKGLINYYNNYNYNIIILHNN